jgi:hypothetical protein
VSAINVTTDVSDLNIQLPGQISTSFPSLDNKLFAPTWDPPKFNPPSIRQRKWNNFFAWLGDNIRYGAYCIGYGIKYAAYSVLYGLKYVGACFDYMYRSLKYVTDSVSKTNEFIEYSNNISNSNIFIYNKIKMITNNDTTEALRDGLLYNIRNFKIVPNNNETINNTNNTINNTNDTIINNITNNTVNINNTNDTIIDNITNNTININNTNNTNISDVNNTNNTNITDIPDANGNINCTNVIGSYNCTNVTNALFCTNVNNSRNVEYITNSNFVFDSNHGDNNTNCANSSDFNNCINCTGIITHNNKINEYRDKNGWYHLIDSGSGKNYATWSDAALSRKVVYFEGTRSQMKTGVLNDLVIATATIGSVTASLGITTIIFTAINAVAAAATEGATAPIGISCIITFAVLSAIGLTATLGLGIALGIINKNYNDLESQELAIKAERDWRALPENMVKVDE